MMQRAKRLHFAACGGTFGNKAVTEQNTDFTQTFKDIVEELAMRQPHKRRRYHSIVRQKNPHTCDIKSEMSPVDKRTFFSTDLPRALSPFTHCDSNKTMLYTN